METKLNDQESLREFLEEAELMHYFDLFRDILKVGKVSQLRYVALEDLAQIGLSKPEQRRFKKIYSKHNPNTYITRLKKLLHVQKKNEEIRNYGREIVVSHDEPDLRISKHIISIEDITINKELGMGQFGVVQQGTWSTGRQRIQVAIKCLGHERMTSNSTEFLKEAAVMHSVEHENIVRLYGVVLHLDSLMLVTELAPLRSLLECLREVSLRSNFPVATLCEFASQICNGMSYLEQKRLIHRDLAARNILVFSKNKVKISDFGLSRALGAGKDYYQTNYNVNLKLPVAWCAPECILYLRFTSASDVWAYGVCLWEMFTYGFQPWVALSGQQILEAIDAPKYQRLERPECCPDSYYELMLECWSHKPGDRPSFKDISPRLPSMIPEKLITISEFKKPDHVRRNVFLEFRAGEIITVIGKEKYTKSALWYGSVSTGTLGLFDPALTKPFAMAHEAPKSPNRNRPRGQLVRCNAKRIPRRIDRSMISGPQNDARHTGHVGQDGAYFGNVPIMESPLSPLPRPTTYPVEEAEPLLNPHSSSHAAGSTTPYPLSSPSSDSSGDKTPIDTMKTKTLMKALKSVSEPTTSKSIFSKVKYATYGRSSKNVTTTTKSDDEHEYHEISDTDTESIVAETPRSESHLGSPGPSNASGDFGNAQINIVVTDPAEENNGGVKKRTDEKKDGKKVDKKDGKKKDDSRKDEKREEKRLEKEEKKLVEAAAKASYDTCTMKLMSSHDLKTLDTACAMANELTSKSMNAMEAKSPGPASEKKFQFKRALNSLQSFTNQETEKESFLGRPERRNFSDEARSVPDIQATLTEESRRAYESLIEQPPALRPLTSDPMNSQVRFRQLRLYTPEPHQPGPSTSQPTSQPCTHHSRYGESQPSNQSGNQSNHYGDSQISSQTCNQENRYGDSQPSSQTGNQGHRYGDSQPSNQTGNHGHRYGDSQPSSQTGNQGHQYGDSQTSSQTGNQGNRFGDSQTSRQTGNQGHRYEDSQPSSQTGNQGHRYGDSQPSNQNGNQGNRYGDSQTSSQTGNQGNRFGDSQTSRQTGIQGNRYDNSQPGPSRILPDTPASPDKKFRYIPKPRLPTPPSDDDSGDDYPPACIPVPPRESKPKLVDMPRHVRRYPLRIQEMEEELLDLSLLPPPNADLYQNMRRYELDNIELENFPVNPFDEVEIPPLEGNPFGAYLGRYDIVDDDNQRIFEEVELGKPPEHVSVEDLLEFADHRPTSQERGLESDEVRIMCKVLNGQVSPEECLAALEVCMWNIHTAIKLCRMRMALFGRAEASDIQCLEVLCITNGDYVKAAAAIIKSFKYND